jgi:hypothetical protein
MDRSLWAGCNAFGAATGARSGVIGGVGRLERRHAGPLPIRDRQDLTRKVVSIGHFETSLTRGQKNRLSGSN